jgi:hypothetical protein
MLCVAALLPGAALLGACGDDGGGAELRSSDANALRSTLDEVEQRVRSQDCTGAGQQAAAFRDAVDGLPQQVDADLRNALSASADRLESLVADQCTPQTTTPTTVPEVGTTSETPAPGNDQNQTDNGNKDKKPKKEKPKKDQTQTEPQTQPDTGGAGGETPGAGDQGGGAPPGE